MSSDIGKTTIGYTVSDLNLALQKLLESRIKILDADGSIFHVPVFFRSRDSKIVSDVLPLASIHISYVGAERAPSEYKQCCHFVEVLKEDPDGNPISYIVKPFPEPMEMTYTIEIRAKEWDDLSNLQEQIDRTFPPTHRALKVKDKNLNLFRRGYVQADNEELGIFIRQWTIGIISFLDVSDCDSTETVYAVRHLEAEIQADPDPDLDISDDITEDIDIF